MSNERDVKELSNYALQLEGRVQFYMIGEELQRRQAGRYKRWSFIFIGCILWQTAVAFTYGMKWVHEQHVNQDLTAQVRALKGGQ